MAVETVTTNICDRCGSRHNAAEYMSGNEWGQTTVQWSGDTGGRSWSGDAGGTSHKGKAWLCLFCTQAFLAFMAPQKTAPKDTP